MTTLRLGQIALPVHDVARATAFYRDVLGLPLLFTAPPGLAFFDCGGVRLMLSRPEGTRGWPASVLYYQVDDLASQHTRLLAAKVAVQGEPHLIAHMPDHELWMGFYADSEGNTLALMEERR
ncbi:VOC family protein [Chitinimonas sp.]|uniref:VOC family protein n=1 Tax=Chitinimonas sp. TaxID=1934313 RepID=UPI002F945ECB